MTPMSGRSPGLLLVAVLTSLQIHQPVSIPVGRNLLAVVPAMGRNYGAAQRVFVIVPLVCGFFIGIPNLLIIAGFVG